MVGFYEMLEGDIENSGHFLEMTVGYRNALGYRYAAVEGMEGPWTAPGAPWWIEQHNIKQLLTFTEVCTVVSFIAVQMSHWFYFFILSIKLSVVKKDFWEVEGYVIKCRDVKKKMRYDDAMLSQDK